MRTLGERAASQDQRRTLIKIAACVEGGFLKSGSNEFLSLDHQLPL
jgi:hypothetical protein